MVEVFFLDTSAIVKRYIQEKGSAQIWSITRPQPRVRVVLSRITWVETLSALSRLHREGRLSKDSLQEATAALGYHFESEYRIVEIDKLVIALAGQLVRQHTLRAYDAVQLASAVRFQRKSLALQAMRLTLITADNQLLAAAKAEGLPTRNPLEETPPR